MAKSKKFDVNPKMAQVFSKFMLWYNQVVDQADELADIAKADETESGEISLKYYTSDTDYIEIKEGGVAVASDGNTPADGEYPLVDGSVLVIADGKFVETKAVDETEEEPVEAPVAEEKQEDEEKPAEEEEEKPADEEEKPVDGEEKPAEDEEKDEEAQEEVEVDAPYTLVPIEIDGVEFNVPQEVADYIKTLEQNLSGAEEVSENFRKEIAQLKERVPSVKPVSTVVKQSKEEIEQKPSFASLINTLNKKL